MPWAGAVPLQEQPERHPSAGCSGSHEHVMWLPDTLDLTGWEQHFTSVVFVPKTQNPSLTMRKTSDNLKLKDILQNT